MTRSQTQPYKRRETWCTPHTVSLNQENSLRISFLLEDWSERNLKEMPLPRSSATATTTQGRGSEEGATSQPFTPV